VSQKSSRGARMKRSFVQSEYITAIWAWFMVLAAKAAEPVLVLSVLYASVKLLPVVHFPPQFDVVIFIAQFVALDVGGLSLNKLADQAMKDGNSKGATAAKRLSIALVVVMLTGVIMAGIGQIVKLDNQLGTVIDTLLLIARAVLAVLYSRVIHSLKKDNEPEPPSKEDIEVLVTEMVDTILSQRLAEFSAQQDETLRRLHHETTETVTSLVETALQQRGGASERAHRTKDTSSANVRSITEAPSRKRGGEREVDKTVWPLLDAGLSVRAIAAQTPFSAGTVGRSRKRWADMQGVSGSHLETLDQPESAERLL
jgi:hypothetical protein